MDKNIELLAPAGDWDAFVAAVENGADAVYLGGKLFNARQFAGNFDNEQLEKAIEYAHIRDASVYLTMNTLMSDSELGQAIEFTGEAYNMGIDGIIVQDIGFAGMVRDVFPDLPLHASTQMTIHNIEGVKLLEKLGFSRAVLARELSLKEIAHITENTHLEIETFIHGALCISYSGQCLMSSIIGGRSGNRGKCAQPCRLPYELVEGKIETGKEKKIKTEIEIRNNTRGKSKEKWVSKDFSTTASGGTASRYLLSPKDMCSIHDLKGIINAGVKSFKIEGRMKNPEYVATVVRIYRKYIDRLLDNAGNEKIEAEDIKALTQIFNRGGLSRGYLGGKTGADMMCYEKPKNWGIYLGEVSSYDYGSKTVKVKLEEALSLGDGVEIWNGENESPGALVSEIRQSGGNTTSARKGDTVTIGSLKGKISKGNKIYKTSDKSLNLQAKESYSGKSFKKAELKANIKISRAQPVSLTVFDDIGNKVTVSGEKLAEGAINRPLTEDRIKEQLEKTGASPFRFSHIDVELEEGLSLPISELNDIRRKALEEMEAKRAIRYTRVLSEEVEFGNKKISYFPGNSRNTSENIKISLHFSSFIKELDYNRLKADRVYFPFAGFFDESAKQAAESLRRNGCEVFVWLPAITRGNYDKLIDSKLREIASMGIDGILAGNPGVVERAREIEGLKVEGDYTFNIFNSIAMMELKKLGLEGCTLSPELNLGQIRDLEYVEGFNKEVIVYGRIPVMTSEYCPTGSLAGGHCKDKKCNTACNNGVYKLKDRMGMEFPIVCDKIDCRSVILNSNVIFVPDSLEKIRKAGVDMLRLNITDEDAGEIGRIVEMHRELANNGADIEQYGKEIKRIRDRGFTKGHFFRGV